MQENTSDKDAKKFSKIFWRTLGLLIVISLAITGFLLVNPPTQPAANKSPIVQPDRVIKVFKLEEVLLKNQPKILENLSTNKELLQETINNKTDVFFEEIKEKNLEAFLDFHYSLKGEYLELGYFLADKLSSDRGSYLQAKIVNQLLGENFESQLNQFLDELNLVSSDALENHLNLISSLATENLDTELNLELFDQLKTKVKQDVTQNLLEAKSALIAGALGVKIAANLATKLAAKITVKTSSKALAKGGAKTTAAATGASAGGLAGLICGPGSVICSPTMAIIGGISAWFLADLAIISLEEVYSRAEFKEEIQLLLEEAQQDLKDQLKVLLTNLEETSKKYQSDIQNLEVKEKRRILDNIK